MPNVATCIYKADDKMVEMLCTYVYSAKKYIDCKVFVYHDGLTAAQQRRVNYLAGDVTFVPIKLKHDTKYHLPAMKVPVWNEIVNDPVHEGSHLILSDFDMLFLRDPQLFWLMDGSDLIHTPKDNQNEKYRLNTGIMFIRDVVSVRRLFKDWTKTVLRIATSKECCEESVKAHGAIDQASFAKYLNPKDYFQSVKILNCCVKGAPSSLYNLHKDWGKIAENCAVIHFKSDWTKVLLSSESYKVALKACGWDKFDDPLKWEPSFKLWRSCYNEMRMEAIENHKE
jgi:hypothetical protein